MLLNEDETCLTLRYARAPDPWQSTSAMPRARERMKPELQHLFRKSLTEGTGVLRNRLADAEIPMH